MNKQKEHMQKMLVWLFLAFSMSRRIGLLVKEICSQEMRVMRLFPFRWRRQRQIRVKSPREGLSLPAESEICWVALFENA